MRRYSTRESYRAQRSSHALFFAFNQSEVLDSVLEPMLIEFGPQVPRGYNIVWEGIRYYGNVDDEMMNQLKDSLTRKGLPFMELDEVELPTECRDHLENQRSSQ